MHMFNEDGIEAMSKIITLLEEAFEVQKQKSNDRRNRIENAWKESNSDILPTLDSQGRYHAPVDGYTIPDSCFDYKVDIEGRIFGAGEYLPVPLTPEDDFFGEFNKFHSDFTYKEKVKAQVSLIKEVKALDGKFGFEVEHGKTWEDGGEEYAYAYIKGIRSMVKAAVAAFEECSKKAEEVEVYVSGKQTVNGQVIFTKITNSEFYGISRKMLVKTAEGAKLWGTLPSAVEIDYRGEIQFTATFEPGQNGMSYFKRPSKVSINK